MTNCTAPNLWGFTLDDGPSPNTEGILSALSQRNVRATFFVTGTQIVKYPDILIKIHEAGHSVELLFSYESK